MNNYAFSDFQIFFGLNIQFYFSLSFSLSICISLVGPFSFKSEPNLNLAEFMISLSVTLWIFMTIFLCCEFGERVINQCELFSDAFGRCDWYLLPIEVRRMLPIILMNFQQPGIIRGYANTVCTREACKLVISDTIHVIFCFLLANRSKSSRHFLNFHILDN